MGFVRDILEQPKNVSAIEIKVAEGFDSFEIKEELLAKVGEQRKVLTRLEQHEFLYKILRSEKWAVYLILSFILLIAVFNIAGSLNMLIIEKKRDIATLYSLGAFQNQIRGIFLLEGLLATLGGAIIGVLLGFAICWAQQQFGLIKLGGGEGYLVESYPVDMQLLDFITVLVLVGCIGFVASFITSRKIEPSAPGKTGN